MTELHVTDFLDMSLLQEMLDKRYVKRVEHPVYDLSILNYTSKAQFDNVWNPVTESCRGLIISRDGFLVSRPFKKFFNLTQVSPLEMPSGSFSTYEKLDGSLGILYKSPDGFKISTRGSFTSDQATWASDIWNERYCDVSIPDDVTLLFEIIHPSNRIVVNYGPRRDLVLIAAIDNLTGRSLPLESVSHIHPWPTAAKHDFKSLSDVTSCPQQDNKEGFVIHFHESDTRFKVKFDEYVRIHRLVTGVSDKRVWEMLSSGRSLDSWLHSVPDEFYNFVTETTNQFSASYARLESELNSLFIEVVSSLEDGFSRADFANVVKKHSKNPVARSLYAKLDKKDYSKALWAILKPASHEPFFYENE